MIRVIHNPGSLEEIALNDIASTNEKAYQSVEKSVRFFILRVKTGWQMIADERQRLANKLDSELLDLTRLGKL